MSWYTIKNPLVIINCRIGSALAYECTFSFVSQKSLLCNILIRIGNINSSSMHHFLLKTWSSGIWPFTRAFVVSTKIFPYNCDVNSTLHSYNPGTGHYFFMPYLAHCSWPSLFRIFSLKKKILNYFYPNKAWLCCQRPKISNRAWSVFITTKDLRLFIKTAQNIFLSSVYFLYSLRIVLNTNLVHHEYQVTFIT